MDKKLKIYIAILILVVIGIVFVESSKSKQINWFPTYAAKHKIPYGTYVLRTEMDALFPNKVKDIHTQPYVFLNDSTYNGTYVFINNTINIDKDEFGELLAFTERGNDVFIASGGVYIDTLGAQTKGVYTTAFEEKTYQKLVNPNFKNQEYSFDRQFSKYYFSEIDTVNTTILGELIVKDGNDSIVKRAPNFIKVKHGKGSFYLHTFPEAFTNYNILLDNNNEYVASVLSYVNDKATVYWDAYYKTGKSRYTSKMQFLLNNESLKWAYYIALIGVLFFIIFKGKRNQRIIPVITPLKNQTLAFTRTIANMYYEKSAHKNIAEHKINYFLEYIRTQYRLSTLKIDENFYSKLASRSGNTLEEVKALFARITTIQQKEHITQEELIAFNKAVEAFKAK
ncbi:conserved protein of unknown function [Tenacibaculum sp. 190130A14a]|uniref:DUF4350 domain-containing protein n=1 Tax=Tenacibaculum polynesiense TaxID=3137857 RepID=A0ABP1EVV3_9FLAO